MSRSNPSHTAALVRRDLLDALRNPTAVATLLACAAIAAVFALTARGGTRFAPGEAPAFLMAAMLACAPSFVGCAMSLYIMSEERERGMYITLAEAGVSMGKVAVAKLIASTISMVVTEAAMYLAIGPGIIAPGAMAAFAAWSVVASMPILIGGITCGLLSRDQTSTSWMSVIIMVVAVSPVLSFTSDNIHAVTWLLPMGPAVELIRLANGMEPMAPAGVLAALMALWTAASVMLARYACRRASDELEKSVMRR